MLKNRSILIVLTVIILFGCSSDRYEETESGLRYKYIKRGDGPTPEDGDYVLLNISYLDEDNNVLFSSTDAKQGPVPLSYVDSILTRSGGLEEGFKMIHKGDSLVLKFPIEDLYENTFSMKLPDSLKRGTDVTICMGAEDVLNLEEYQAYREEKYLKLQQDAKIAEGFQFETDKKIIDDYLKEKNIETEFHQSGLRYRILKKGDGPLPQIGETVHVNYTGRFLNGNIFDTSDKELAKAEGIYDPRREPYEPISFELGTGGVIPGWDIGIGLLHQGGKAVFYVPSKLAYGPRQGSAIPANSIMIFDVELVGIDN